MGALREAQPPELVVVVPVFNEAMNIRAVVSEWFDCLRAIGADFAFLAVNDGSTDNTREVLTELAGKLGSRFRVVTKPNTGHGRTCREGYEQALAEGATWIFQIDSDGQCDPAFFPEMYSARADHDCLFGYRTRRDDGWGRTAVSAFCRTLLFVISGTYLRDPNVPYRLMRAGVLRTAFHRIPADFDLQNIALTFALNQEPDVRWKHVPIHFRARRAGENSINYRKIMKMGINLLRNFGRLRHEECPRWPRMAWTRRRAVS